MWGAAESPGAERSLPTTRRQSRWNCEAQDWETAVLVAPAPPVVLVAPAPPAAPVPGLTSQDDATEEQEGGDGEGEDVKLEQLGGKLLERFGILGMTAITLTGGFTGLAMAVSMVSVGDAVGGAAGAAGATDPGGELPPSSDPSPPPTPR
jgi:hypothetical protein